DGPIDERRAEELELVAPERSLEVERTSAGADGDERDVHLGLDRRAELVLGLLGSLFQALEGHPIFSEIEVFLGEKLVGEHVDDQLIEILAAEVGVAAGRLDAEDAGLDLED